MPLRTLVATALLALTLALGAALPALGSDGVTHVAGLGRIHVFDALGNEVCVDNAYISLALAWTEELEGAPSGYYQSTSACASFAYPIHVAQDCTGAPGARVRCDETGPPRWFTIEPNGWFWYERDNLGLHFEVWGWLQRNDAAP
jgi:hypothetical protein